jgi:hippurate hydrolase
MNIKLILSLLVLSASVLSGQSGKPTENIIKQVTQLTEKYNNIYQDLHRNPELSYMEFETSKKMAKELKSLGFEVTTGFGGNGVVGIMRNGTGRTVMLRTDMDALPVKENTGLPFASTSIMKNSTGKEFPAMHACGHDLHMSVWLGTLETLMELKSQWKGTIIAVAEPAEEVSGGSDSLIKNGLFKKFPIPDAILCYHVSPELPAGSIGYNPGPIFAGVSSCDITVYGRGGHGAMPHKTIDPVVLASRIVLDLQTIVSREINPVSPAVVTVAAINGGFKNNVIPDEVKMLMTLRFFDDKVFAQIKSAIIRITRGAAIAAGVAEDRLPKVEFSQEATPPVINNERLVLQASGYMKNILGNENVVRVDPAMVAEDFGLYGRTEEKIPIALFWLGGVSQSKYKDYIENGIVLPYLHNSSFAPDFEPAFKCGVSAMSNAVIGLLNEKQKSNQ